MKPFIEGVVRLLVVMLICIPLAIAAKAFEHWSDPNHKPPPTCLTPKQWEAIAKHELLRKKTVEAGKELDDRHLEEAAAASRSAAALVWELRDPAFAHVDEQWPGKLDALRLSLLKMAKGIDQRDMASAVKAGTEIDAYWEWYTSRVPKHYTILK